MDQLQFAVLFDAMQQNTRADTRPQKSAQTATAPRPLRARTASGLRRWADRLEPSTGHR